VAAGLVSVPTFVAMMSAIPVFLSECVMKKSRITGTREWSVGTVNCCKGCTHNCRYCWARAQALRFKWIQSPEQWLLPQVRQHEVTKKRKKAKGTIMFPSTHDITPEVLVPCTRVLRNLLEAGNRVLVVSKPHWETIQTICAEFADYRPRILFRFTIGAEDNEILSYWEPNAPGFEERLACLQHAHGEGFQTSISVEPMLDSAGVVDLVHTLASLVTDSIWIGKMNRIRHAFKAVSDKDEAAIQEIQQGQTDARIWAIYDALKYHPKVSWKDSVKKVVGIAPLAQPGLDK